MNEAVEQRLACTRDEMLLLLGYGDVRYLGRKESYQRVSSGGLDDPELPQKSVRAPANAG